MPIYSYCMTLTSIYGKLRLGEKKELSYNCTRTTPRGLFSYKILYVCTGHKPVLVTNFKKQISTLKVQLKDSLVVCKDKKCN